MKLKMRMAAFACIVLPLAVTARAQQLTPAEEGRRLFLANNCYGCHGGRGGGTSFGAPQLRRETPELSDLSDVLREGGERGMPAFPNLNNTTDLNNLYAYFRSMRTSSEPVFNRWWEPVPSAGLQPRTPRLYALARVKRVHVSGQ